MYLALAGRLKVTLAPKCQLIDVAHRPVLKYRFQSQDGIKRPGVGFRCHAVHGQ